MSITSGLVKTAVKWTPKALILWVANKVLKGIAEVSDFELDLDARTAYALTTLNGESESIEVWLNGFSVISEEGYYHLLLESAESNKPWLNTIFSHITGRAWKIPDVPKFRSQIGLLAELLKPIPATVPEQAEQSEQPERQETV